MKNYKDRDGLLEFFPKGLKVAELGVFTGNYSKKIYNIMKPSQLYLVDVFAKAEGNSMGEHVDDMSTLEMKHILTYKDDPNVFVLKMTTKDFLESIMEGWLDMVYIDADHTYHAVKQDLEGSRIAVRNGGWITGHDYDKISVKSAVDEFCKKHGLEISILSLEHNPSFVIVNNK